MSRQETKVGRLVRLHEFKEEVAEGILRKAGVARAEAETADRDALTALESLGRWKSQANQVRGLDLGLYGAVLAIEEGAMQRSSETRAMLRERQEEFLQAQQGMQVAATATRVSTQRRQHQRRSIEAEGEKKQFDQVSDMWLNNRRESDD